MRSSRLPSPIPASPRWEHPGLAAGGRLCRLLDMGAQRTPRQVGDRAVLPGKHRTDRRGFQRRQRDPGGVPCPGHHGRARGAGDGRGRHHRFAVIGAPPSPRPRGGIGEAGARTHSAPEKRPQQHRLPRYPHPLAECRGTPADAAFRESDPVSDLGRAVLPRTQRAWRRLHRRAGGVRRGRADLLVDIEGPAARAPFCVPLP